ncbi:hypothetical protein [Belliella aquatica]|uniref:Microcystin-dependent protein n=1 Tax=Belliella aquatica TaxID=1323734 RepID=A0ABQ1N5R5_9BACT|nr:hypothetical protein [Belliella aquatica]MCH7407610.1 hypothetical protein [Belliella aquatica]GGC55076.1 hypothetical protein GCM10010993_36770 [Belliella aquatica]
MKKVLHTLAAILISVVSYAQVGIGTDNPDNSAMLQVASSEKGFLLPQMTSTQRNAVSSPANGLQVYDTTTNSIWFFNGSYWVNTQAMATVGDVKSGLQTNDHSGWVLLDGRSIGTLSDNQKAAASALGLSGTLPNAADAYLVQNGGSMGAISGSNTVTLTQANLPNVSFSGTAASAGGHTHTVDPAPVDTDSKGNHTHTVDPAPVNTDTKGEHTHTGSVGGSNWLGGGTLTGGFNAGTFPFQIPNLTINPAGDHFHTVDIPSTTSSENGAHKHSIDIPSTTSSSNGAHTHDVTVSSGGSATPVNVAPKSLSVNMFIYLGL